jgi:methylenetetrahydrofolate reductase (NADPH)
MATAGRVGGGVDPHALIDRWSIEITAKDAPELERAAPLIPPGTKIPVTFLPNERFDARVAAAATVRRLGFIPIPHISARRIHSREELEGFLVALQREAAIDHAFVVAGDPLQPMGPFADALSLIRSDLLAAHGVTRVGISGYPEGHPEIGSDSLWDAGRDKRLALTERGHDFAIVTQFSFDAEPVLEWIARQRAEGIQALIRVGVPGPASVKTLLRFAARCGVGASAKVMSRYGLSMTRLLGTAGPDRLVEDLAAGLDPTIHGEVRLHFYPFGGIENTAAWIRDYRKGRA